MASPVLTELFSRIAPAAEAAVEGLSEDELRRSPGGGANPIGWLVWHIARIHDDHFADAFGTGQLWEEGDWAQRFGLAPDPSNIGYGHGPEEVAAVRGDADAVIDYLRAVTARTAEHLEQLDDAELDRVVDTSYDPPVTLLVRLVSVATDGLMHAGQAAYARGQLGR